MVSFLIKGGLRLLKWKWYSTESLGSKMVIATYFNRAEAKKAASQLDYNLFTSSNYSPFGVRAFLVVRDGRVNGLGGE